MINFSDLKPFLSASDRVLVYMQGDEIQAVLPLTPDQILITYETMVELLERAGYEVRKK